MLLPIPLPDELFASMLARLGRLNGMGDLREVAERCFGLETCPSFIDARLKLPDFCARLSNAYGEPEKLLGELTTLGARRFLGEIDETVWKSLVGGETSISVGELTFFGAVDLRFCPSCREEDIDRHGVAYWHRVHQLPILHRCVTHGDRLKKAVIKRVALHQSFPLPGDFSDERQVDLPLVWNERFEIEQAVFSRALLTQELLGQGLVGQALLDGLWAWGFLNSKGSLRTRELLEFLTARIGHDDGSEQPEIGLGVARQIVRRILEPARGLAFGRALLLCALFGNWRIVAERCKWLEALGMSVECNVREVRKLEQNASDVKERHRGKCLAYISNNAVCSRLSFTRQHYRSFRWLLHYDRPWLDCRLPVVEREREQLTLF